MLPYVEDHILKWGKLHALLHDNGWWIAWDQIIKAQGRWPTRATFAER